MFPFSFYVACLHTPVCVRGMVGCWERDRGWGGEGGEEGLGGGWEVELGGFRGRGVVQHLSGTAVADLSICL